VPDSVTDLLATEAALDNSVREASPRRKPVSCCATITSPSATPHEREPGTRRLLIGRTDGGRYMTLVIERTLEPTTWLIVTGWGSTEVERKMLGEEND